MENVGKSQSRMVSKSRIIWTQTVVAIAPDEYYKLELPAWASELSDAQRAVIMPPKSYERDLVVRLNTGACTRNSRYSSMHD